MTAAATALCDKFTKTSGKRGKPARNSLCAVCEVVWTQHYNEKMSERGQQQPVLHAEMIRIIPEPKRGQRSSKAGSEPIRPKVRAMLIPGAALCDRFTKANGKRGKPAKDSLCAVCETMWLDHFTEKDPSLYPQQSVIHREKIRDIPVPKRRKPKAEKTIIEPEVEEPEVEEPELPDLMLCGHPIEALGDVDGEEACQECVESKRRSVALWATMKQHWLDTEKARHPEMTPSELEAAYQAECDVDW